MELEMGKSVEKKKKVIRKDGQHAGTKGLSIYRLKKEKRMRPKRRGLQQGKLSRKKPGRVAS